MLSSACRPCLFSIASGYKIGVVPPGLVISFFRRKKKKTEKSKG
jgi:hypothetical protein